MATPPGDEQDRIAEIEMPDLAAIVETPPPPCRGRRAHPATLGHPNLAYCRIVSGDKANLPSALYRRPLRAEHTAGREGAQIGRCIRMASIATPSGMVKMHSSKS